MNIIFGKEKLAGIDSKYTILELDTIRLPDQDKSVTAYCLIESIPITEMASIDQSRDLHENLIKIYRLQTWKYCEDALVHLIGNWNREVDSFYTDLAGRVQQNKLNGVDESWDGTVLRSKKYSDQ